MLTNQVSDVDIQPRRRYSQSLKPCGLQKLLLNHRSSFCWILSAAFDTVNHQILSTLLSLGINRDSTSLVWILSHWQVLQGGLGRGGIQSTSTGHWGSSGVSSWTTPLLHIHYITGSYHPPTSTHWWQSTSPPEAWDLRVSNASWCHHREAQNHVPEHFPFTVPGWFLTIFKRHLKPHLFHLHLISASSHICSLSFTSPCLASFALNNACNVVLQALSVTVCLFIMYHLLYSSIVNRFG